MTFTAGATLTAAQLNTHLRDNLNETAPAKATTAGQLFVATATNAIAARTIMSDFYASGGTDTTNSTSYIALTGGGAVTATTGSSALVAHYCQLTNDTVASRTRASYAVSGASTIAANDNYAIATDPSGGGRVIACTVFHKLNGLTAGSNTFTQQFKVNSGIGTFAPRGIVVVPL